LKTIKSDLLEMLLPKITIAQLESFVRSEEYRTMNELPITPLRALSQANNPKARPDDVVLTLAMSEEGELLGYVGALPDWAGSIRCAWNSCWRVKEGAPAEVSMKLLYSFLNDWDRKILLADMTPHTHKLIQQLRICTHRSLHGIRCFYRLNLARRLGKKFRNRILRNLAGGAGTIVDGLLSLFVCIAIPKKRVSGICIEEIPCPTPELDSFISRHNTHQPAKRLSADFRWMREYPWISDREEEKTGMEGRYYFSWFTERFETHWIRFAAHAETVALLGYTLRDDILNVRYLYAANDTIPNIGRFLLQQIRTDRLLSSVITYHPGLTAYLQSRKNFLFCRKITRLTALSKKLCSPDEAESFILQSGDGDCMFT